MICKTMRYHKIQFNSMHTSYLSPAPLAVPNIWFHVHSTIRCHAIQHQHQSALNKIDINQWQYHCQSTRQSVYIGKNATTHPPTYLSVDVFPNILLTRTLLWEAGEADKFVGTDLSSETTWRHQSIPVPVNPKDSKVYFQTVFKSWREYKNQQRKFLVDCVADYDIVLPQKLW